MTATLSPPQRSFYGWYIVAGVFVITTTTSGLAFYNLSILLAAFVAERGFPVALASSATATFFIASGIGGVISGRLIERIDARFVIATSAMVGGLALASLSSLRETWQLYAFHVVFGFSHGSSGLVPATTLVARWFNVRRALAFSIAFTGLSFGGILIAPAVALTIERLGLSGAAPVRMATWSAANARRARAAACMTIKASANPRVGTHSISQPPSSLPMVLAMAMKASASAAAATPARRLASR